MPVEYRADRQVHNAIVPDPLTERTAEEEQMVDYEHEAPGVYVEEVETAGPIAGAGTSTAAFIGTATTLGEGVSSAGRCR